MEAAKYKIEHLDDQIHKCQRINGYIWRKRHWFSRQKEWVLEWAHTIGNKYKSPTIKNKDHVVVEMERELQRTLKDYNVVELVKGVLTNPLMRTEKYVVLEHLPNDYVNGDVIQKRFWTSNSHNNIHLYDGTLAYKEILFTNDEKEAIAACK